MAMSFRLNSKFFRPLWKRVLQPSALVITAIATLLAVSLFSVSSLTAAPSAKVQFVSPAWVAANANDPNLRILDVRNFPLEYIAGHLPNAVNIADIAFRGPDGFLPVQYWETRKLGKSFLDRVSIRIVVCLSIPMRVMFWEPRWLPMC